MQQVEVIGYIFGIGFIVWFIGMILIFTLGSYILGKDNEE
jgi:hypothetical protein